MIPMTLSSFRQGMDIDLTHCFGLMTTNKPSYLLLAERHVIRNGSK
ncbi:MAG: hypothetical protein ACR5K4_02165 [Sodalis sp. (in: enterobacteria)]